MLVAQLTDVASTYIVFPDGGAHRRFYTMVQACVPGIALANIVFIQKSRTPPRAPRAARRRRAPVPRGAAASRINPRLGAQACRARTCPVRLTRVRAVHRTGVGAEVTQKEELLYLDAEGATQTRAGELPDGARVLIADDFTNSGSTLFGAADILKKKTAPGATVRPATATATTITSATSTPSTNTGTTSTSTSTASTAAPPVPPPAPPPPPPPPPRRP